MKNTPLSFITILIVISVTVSCDKDCEDYISEYYKPVYSNWSSIKNQIGSEAPKSIKDPGKIFAYGNYIFISEINEGVHIIDNSNPSAPVNAKFINVPGSLDIAVLGNRLFADNYSDIIELDISDFDHVFEVNRVSNVFSSNSLGHYFESSDESVITAWEVVDTVIEVECPKKRPFVQYDVAVSTVNQQTGAEFGNSGKAGSMARFALYNSKLYALNEYQINIFDIGDQFELGNVFDINWGIETIFPYDHYLFIGANDGMYILDISSPLNPQIVSSYQHITACDPVVVKNDIAYVTLRSGNECDNFTNQLEVIDVSNKSNPILLKTYPMFNPHGLGVANSDLLFICDGDDGLKVYDNSNIEDIQLLEHYTNINAFDVIPYQNDYLLMIGNDGFYQYDYSDIENINLVSYIEVMN